MSVCKTVSHHQVHQLLDEVLGPGLHAKRIALLANATLGVMHTASLAVCTIGHGLAMARELKPDRPAQRAPRQDGATGMHTGSPITQQEKPAWLRSRARLR